MKVKTYNTRSLHEGLEDIKRDLGSEALILSTRSVSVRPRFSLFKKPAWEITAALEGKVEPKPEPSLVAKRQLRISSSTSAAVATARARTARDSRMEELIAEISDLKKSLRSLTKAIPGKSDFGDGMFAELVSQGIDHDIADHLIATASRGNPAPSEQRSFVRRLLADQLNIAAPVELYAKTPVVSAFVGPTGVRKTTTIAQIAGHASIRMKKKVALISTDTARIGGHEQLARLGGLLGIPTYACADVSTLKDLVASLDDCNLVLIDTPGSSPSDLSRLSRLEALTSSADAKVHLVISATTRSDDITNIVSRFHRFTPTSVILTNIDETDSKGPLTADLLKNEVPVSYLTNGQRVPEDLLIPSADGLARYVLPVEPAI